MTLTKNPQNDTNKLRLAKMIHKNETYKNDPQKRDSQKCDSTRPKGLLDPKCRFKL